MNVQKLLERKKKLESAVKEQAKKIKLAEAAAKRQKTEQVYQIIAECGLADMPPEELRSLLQKVQAERGGSE